MYVGSLDNRVLSLVNDYSIPLFPIQIAELLHANKSSVRGCLRRLVVKGKICQPYSGVYCSKNTYGVRFPLSVHNVRLSCLVGEDIVHWEKTEMVGRVKVFVCFGSSRRKISGWISCNTGMSKDACLLALNRWIDVAQEKLGRNLEKIEVKGFEFNRDYLGVSLTGFTCFSVKGLFGFIERVYQKGEDIVRHEVKVNRKVSLTEFDSLLEGGLVAFGGAQAFYYLTKRVEDLTDALKFMNSNSGKLQDQIQAIYDWIIRYLRDKEGFDG